MARGTTSEVIEDVFTSTFTTEDWNSDHRIKEKLQCASSGNLMGSIHQIPERSRALFSLGQSRSLKNIQPNFIENWQFLDTCQFLIFHGRLKLSQLGIFFQNYLRGN